MFGSAGRLLGVGLGLSGRAAGFGTLYGQGCNAGGDAEGVVWVAEPAACEVDEAVGEAPVASMAAVRASLAVRSRRSPCHTHTAALAC